MGVKLTKAMIAGAKKTEELYGIPSSVTLGQIMLESGGDHEGGLSGLAFNYKNLFGVTAGSNWTGEKVTLSNKAGTDTKTYRVYTSYMDSIIDHGVVLMNERYTKYTSKAKNYEEYVDGIAKGGYAESPTYAEDLKSVIRSNNLTAYDGDSWVGKTKKPNSSSSSNTNKLPVSEEKKEEDVDLKWWGDLFVVILSILIIGLAIIFFLSAFGGISMPFGFPGLKKG